MELAGLVTKFKQRYPLPPLVWYIIIETGLARIAFFMAMPFIALRMHEATQSSAATIGLVIGLGPLISTFIGFYVGHLSDLWGRRNILVSALLLWAAVFYAFSLATTPLHYAILMGLNGLTRGIFEPVCGALLSDLCSGPSSPPDLRKTAFHLRYYAINVGAATGPLMGAGLVLNRPELGFQIASVVYLTSALLLIYFSHRFGLQGFEKARQKSVHSFSQVVDVLLSDRTLQIYLLGFFLISFSFSQLEVTLPLFLKRLFSDDGVRLFGKMLGLNGSMVVLLTIPLLAWAKRFDLNVSCAVCALIWASGFLAMAFSSTPAHFLLSMFILTVGEIVVFANGYLMIESLAPENMKGAYLGTTNLSQMGVVIGPVLGGYIFEYGGGVLLFSTMAFFMAICSGLYILAKRRRGINAAPVIHEPEQLPL